MINTPLISIVIATYNPGLVFKQCIESLNSQSFSDYEVLVSDGCSNDGTVELISNTFIRNLQWSKSAPDNGLYYAINNALIHVRGKWLLVIGADDVLSGPEALGNISEYLSCAEESIGLIYTNLVICSDGLRRVKRYPSYKVFCEMYRGFPPIHHQTAFIRSQIVLELNGFNTTYRIHSDYDLISRVLNRADAIKIDSLVVEFSDNGLSASLNNFTSSIREIVKIRSSLGVKKLPYKFIIIYMRHFTKILLKLFLPNSFYNIIFKIKQFGKI